MRTLLICLILVSTSVFAQEKAPPLERENLTLGASECDSDSANLLSNCGFETGDFTDWGLAGAMDYVSVSTGAAHSGNYGGSFGAVGDLTVLEQPVDTIPGQFYGIEFWLANLVGGSGTFFGAYWCGASEDCFPLLVLEDPDPFDWTLHTFGATADSRVSYIRFLIRHDPNYFYLDDVDVN